MTNSVIYTGWFGITYEQAFRIIIFLLKNTCWIRILPILSDPIYVYGISGGEECGRWRRRSRPVRVVCVQTSMRILQVLFSTLSSVVRPPPRWSYNPSGINIATTTLTTIIKYQPLVSVALVRLVLSKSHCPSSNRQSAMTCILYRRGCNRQSRLNNIIDVVCVPPKTITNDDCCQLSQNFNCSFIGTRNMVLFDYIDNNTVWYLSYFVTFRYFYAFLRTLLLCSFLIFLENYTYRL